MRFILFSIFSMLLFTVGCVTNQYAPENQNPTARHQYELTVVDLEGRLLEGVQIDYVLKDNGYSIEKTTSVTISDGKVSVSLPVAPESLGTYPPYYKSEFNYKTSINGFYSTSGKMSQYATYSDFTPVSIKTITLIRPINYFNNSFASTLSDIKLKTRILSFIDLIIMQGLVTNSVLKLKSVNLVPFKKNSYLQFKFTNASVYNSLKLNKYDIGKRLFDEVIREILSPLNEHISETDLFYGYDLIVVGHTKSFVDEFATAKPVKYRFMIPDKIVKKYKNKDISGQQVLDSSVILMDDERIELKLQ